MTAESPATLTEGGLPPQALPQNGPAFGPVLSLIFGRTLAFVATFFIPVVLARVFAPARFATYKQLFLIHSTVYLIAQVGMATSLYYFLPRTPRAAGRYVANSLLFLGAAGFAGFGALQLLAPKIAVWLNNAELSRYIFWIGLYLFLMMLSAGLEIVLISRGRYRWASASYALYDVARAVASILPVLLLRDLDGLLKGLALAAGLRAVIAVVYFRMEFRDDFRPDRALLRSQLAYALPFALAVVVEIVQGSLPQYLVAYLTSPATFVIFAVGCLSIPLVDVAATPSSDVMMVKMQEKLAAGPGSSLLEIWWETTRKLALLFFPLAVMVVISAREIIVLLFTARYVAAIPIFVVWSLTIPLAALQVDGVLRVFAQTRLLLLLNLIRLAITAGLIQWSLSRFSLVGPVFVIVLATAAFKAGALVRMTGLLQVPARQLLPWRNLAAVLGASAGAAVVAMAVKLHMGVPSLPLLIATSTAYFIAYALLVWRFNLLSTNERQKFAGWVRASRGGISRIFDSGRG